MAPHILLKRLLTPSPIIFWAYVLPFLYWSYLVLTTNFVVVFDSESYCDLANILYSPSHWTEYFQNGPNREPLYPLIIALSMHLGSCLNVSYEYILRTVSFLFLAATMFFIHQSLKKMNVNRWLQAAAILYTGFSPVLINSALCVFSEIASFPFLVAAVYFGLRFMDSLGEKNPAHLYSSWGLALSLLGFTLVKGMGEVLFPLFVLCLIGFAWDVSAEKLPLFLRRSKIKILIVFLIFYTPLLGFKSINYFQNGHFALTSRADVNIYGNLLRRSHVPLNTTNFLSHLLTIPVSYDLCGTFYPDSVCSQWSMTTSDETFNTRRNQLNEQHLNDAQKNKIYAHEILNALLTTAPAQAVYFVQESLKMFYWETSQGPFVIYPEWLKHVFSTHWLVLFMAFGIGSICLITFLISFTMLKNKLILVTISILSLLIFLFSFVHIIQRYATIAAPLMILLAFACCDGIIKSRKKA